MTHFPRAVSLFILAAIPPLLAAPLSASGAVAHRTRVTPTVRKPTVADNAIIALPLNPVVPAAQRQCAVRTSSGLGYTMLRPATGTKPGHGDLVLVNYIGYLANTGVVFDQGTRSALSVDGVIPGFSEGLQLLARSGIARFCIPAAIGYGARANGPIPANADLVFQVELIDYKPAAGAEGAADAQDTPPAS